MYGASILHNGWFLQWDLHDGAEQHGYSNRNFFVFSIGLPIKRHSFFFDHDFSDRAQLKDIRGASPIASQEGRSIIWIPRPSLFDYFLSR
jgi:hypothetical protein